MDALGLKRCRVRLENRPAERESNDLRFINGIDDPLIQLPNLPGLSEIASGRFHQWLMEVLQTIGNASIGHLEGMLEAALRDSSMACTPQVRANFRVYYGIETERPDWPFFWRKCWSSPRSRSLVVPTDWVSGGTLQMDDTYVIGGGGGSFLEKIARLLSSPEMLRLIQQAGRALDEELRVWQRQPSDWLEERVKPAIKEREGCDEIEFLAR